MHDQPLLSMDPQKLSAQELVQLCLDSQDEALWTEFVRRFQPLIARVVMKCVLRRNRQSISLVDDLVQDTYTKLCLNNRQALRDFDFQHENAFFGFLKVVANHVVEDYFRGSTSQKRGSGREEEDIEQVRSVTVTGHGSYHPLDRQILLREIEECLSEEAAEPNFKRDIVIFWLYYRQGLTAKAIASLPSIDLSVKGVESTLFRLTRIVRTKLASQTSKRRASGG
jgi:RNA polymerase sigma-70 factor (ECF subfamily)